MARRIVSKITAGGSYERLDPDDNTELLDGVFASRKAPGSLTDREQLAGLAEDANGNQTPRLRALAKKFYGFTPGPNDVYLSQLTPYGQRPCHPQAWVPPGNARGHMKRVLESMGAGCDGLVKTKRREVEPPPPVKLAPKIVNRLVKKMVRDDPSLATKPLKELKEMAVDRHGPKS